MMRFNATTVQKDQILTSDVYVSVLALQSMSQGAFLTEVNVLDEFKPPVTSGLFGAHVWLQPIYAHTAESVADRRTKGGLSE